MNLEVTSGDGPPTLPSHDAQGHARLYHVNSGIALRAGTLRRGLVVLPLLLAAAWCGAETEVREPVHKLPPFVVTEAPEELPWQYGAVAGFEVLSLCDDELTREFLVGQRRGTLFLPETFRKELSSPVQVVLWAGRNLPLAPTRKQSWWRSGYDFGWDSARGWFIPNIIAADEGDSLVMAANFQRVDEYESAAIHLARWRMQCEHPTLPWWIREGLAGDYGLFPGDLGIQGIGYRNRPTGNIRLPRLPWPDGAIGDLIPLQEFFLHFPDETAGVSEMRLWHAQAGLLVRWALFGPELRAERTRALWALAEVARYRPITEEDFQVAFGLCFTEAEQELARFREAARWDAPWIRVPGFERDLPEFGEFSLRRATEAEVARLRGNFERVEMSRWRATAPELAAKYEVAARRTLERGLRCASDDARVHAVYGLLEYETGHPAEARPHLEYAFAHGAAGSRALLALARVRLADLSVGLTAGDRLPEEVLERVLTPLFAAKDLRPALAEVYQCIGEVWERSAVAPRRGHLAALAEGVALFPDAAELRLQAVRLHHLYGFEREAAALADEGVRRASTATARAKFASWRMLIPGAQTPP